MTATVPAKVQILVDQADFPTIDAFDVWRRQPGNTGGSEADFLAAIRGPAGANPLWSTWVPAGASTSSASFVAIPGLTLTVNGGGRNKIEVSGVIGHDTSETISQITIFRQVGTGPAVDLKPDSASGLATVRQVGPGYTHPFTVLAVDDPQDSGDVTYNVAWMTHGGTAHLGKRPTDAVMAIPTTFVITRGA